MKKDISFKKYSLARCLIETHKMINFEKKSKMKNLTLSLLFITFASVSFSQEKLVWHEDLNEAVAISQKENKPLMLFFTGSDWCGWCIRLQKEVFFKPEFTKWANENVVLVELDYPRKKAQSKELKAQNSQLQQQFQVRGYPTIWFVKADKNSSGQVNLSQLGKTGYVKGGPAAWIETANQLLFPQTKKEKSPEVEKNPTPKPEGVKKPVLKKDTPKVKKDKNRR